MKHKFESLGSVQWCKLGLPYEAARSDYQCSKCRTKFSHYYRIEPNIHKAMKDVGIDEDGCTENEETPCK